MWSLCRSASQQGRAGWCRVIESVRPVSITILLLSIFFCDVAFPAFWQQSIERSEWQTSLERRALTELEAVRELFSRFEERPDVIITVRYPGGDFGSDWALEFRDWMVALGIPSSYLELVPGSGGTDVLNISMVSEG